MAPRLQRDRSRRQEDEDSREPTVASSESSSASPRRSGCSESGYPLAPTWGASRSPGRGGERCGWVPEPPQAGMVWAQRCALASLPSPRDALPRDLSRSCHGTHRRDDTISTARWRRETLLFAVSCTRGRKMRHEGSVIPSFPSEAAACRLPPDFPGQPGAQSGSTGRERTAGCCPVLLPSGQDRRIELSGQVILLIRRFPLLC